MKTSIYVAVFTLMIAVFVLPSCKSREENKENTGTCCQAVNTDSLIALWNTAWNGNNLQALKNMVADSAIAIDHDWFVKGRDSIAAQWFGPSVGKISNVKTTPLFSRSDCCCASMTGFYTLDYTTKEGTRPSKGNFTFTWMQQEDKSWKLVVMHLTEFEQKAAK